MTAVLASPGFGNDFTDHMVLATWTRRAGLARRARSRRTGRSRWTRPPRCCTTRRRSSRASRPTATPTARSGPSGPRPTRPGSSARPRRLALPAAARGGLPRVAARCSSPPTRRGSRPGRRRGQPLPAAVHVRLRGVPRACGPRPTVTYCVIASPAGAYFAGGRQAGVDLAVHATTPAPPRAAPARPSAAATTPPAWPPQVEATANGCDQVGFLDAVERRWVEELGGMNLYFVHGDGTLVTPELTGTILEGVTRYSILDAGRGAGPPGRGAPDLHRRVA